MQSIALHKLCWADIFIRFEKEIKNENLKLNFEFFDRNGLNALHAAVMMNDYDIIKVILLNYLKTKIK